jgi:hypothetical protein
MSFNIVNLIEANPITRFSGDYQSKIIDKIRNNFTEYQQQLFLSSSYCFLQYDFKNDYVVDLDDIWKWLGFSQKISAKVVLDKNFIINVDYKIIAHEVAKKDQHGGHNKQIIKLNVNAFKRFCLKAGTKKADEIHEYFIKLEEIMQELLIEERDEQFKKQIEQMQIEQNKINEEYNKKIILQRILDKEQILLSEYKDSGPLIYLVKVKTYEDGKYVIKIGHSAIGIYNRYTEHKNNYEECVLLDCFYVDKSREFESFIHNNELIRKNKFKQLFNHESENELFLIGGELTYKIVLSVINKNIKNYNLTVKEVLQENEILKHKLLNNESTINNEILITILQELKDIKCYNQELLQRIDNLEKQKKEPEPIINTRLTGFGEPIQTLGPRLQKINPETLEIVQVYDTATDLLTENNKIKRPSLNKAVADNTIYCGYRWVFVERDLDQNILHNLQPTKKSKVQNLGYIAKINKDKTEIINVYLNRKTAAKDAGLKDYGLDTAVSKCLLVKDHYYIVYDDCDCELINDFEEKYGEVLLYIDGLGQFTSDGTLKQKFECKYYCGKQLKIGDKTLNKCIENNIPYNGFFYKKIGDKLKHL